MTTRDFQPANNNCESLSSRMGEIKVSFDFSFCQTCTIYEHANNLSRMESYSYLFTLIFKVGIGNLCIMEGLRAFLHPSRLH
jgi:hypothetical protein